MPTPAADARLPDATPTSPDTLTSDAATAATQTAADAAPLTAEEMAAHLSLRDVVLRAYPDVVAELVQGETLADLLGCVPTAQQAWQRVVAQVGHEPHATSSAADAALAAATTPTLPASSVTVPGQAVLLPLPGVAGGSVVRSAQPGLEQMTPLARIRAGLRG